jgi:hypothetical protein
MEFPGALYVGVKTISGDYVSQYNTHNSLYMLKVVNL